MERNFIYKNGIRVTGPHSGFIWLQVHVNLQKIIQKKRNYFVDLSSRAGGFVGLNKNPSANAAVITAASSASVGIGAALEVQEIRERSNKWQWNQFSINYFVSHYQPSQQQPQSSSNPPVVLLVHGFGASIPHWRRFISFSLLHQLLSIRCYSFLTYLELNFKG